MTMIRAFIGIGISSEINKRLNQDCENLQNQYGLADNEHLRWIAPRNRHITLLFLGNVELQACLDCWKTLSKTTLQPPQPCLFDQINHFPDAKSRIIALTESAPTGMLNPLKQHINEVFSELAPSSKAAHKTFRPHITLARIRKHKQVEFSATHVDYSFSADSLVLYKSQLSDSGSEYEKLREIRF